MLYLLQKISPQRLLGLLIIMHVLLWTMLPVLLRPNAPLDVIEAILWGHEWAWGYDKHPPLSGWFAEMFFQLSHPRMWGVYFLSQLCIGLSFGALWLLARDLLKNDLKALLSVLLLEGIYYYHFTSPEFNVNVLLLPLWSFSLYFFWKGVKDNKWFHWALVGFFLGLACLTKYYTAVLIGGMVVYLLGTKQGRAHFWHWGRLLGLGIFFLVLAPHVVWMVQHDFITLAYVQHRGANVETSWLNHLINPVSFTLSQMGAVAFATLLFLTLKPKFQGVWKQSLTSEKRFILILLWVPFFLTILLSLVTGMKLKSMWGTPLFGLWGMFLLSFFTVSLEEKYLRRFQAGFWALIIFVIILYTGTTLLNLSKRTNFPGKELAQQMEHYWEEHYLRPLAYVGGDLWLAGNVAAYADHRPSVFIDLDQQRSAWIRQEDFEQTGGIVLWEGEGSFPGTPSISLSRLIVQEPLELKLKNTMQEKTIVVQWAIWEPSHAKP